MDDSVSMGVKKKRTPPKPGTRFTREYLGKTHTLSVLEEGGRIVYRMQGTTFNSPTEAAHSLTNYQVNGWYFWQMDDSVSQGAARRSRQRKLTPPSTR
jgi:hypothetical protein